MLNAELLSDLQRHRKDLKSLGIKFGPDTNALLDRFLRDFCDNSQTLTSMSDDSKKHTNFESAQMFLIQLSELESLQ